VTDDSIVEIRVVEEATHRTAVTAARRIREELALAPAKLWLNFESVKVVDVVGLSVVTEAMLRARAAGSECAIFPSPIVHRGLFMAGLLDRFATDPRRADERPEPARVVEVHADEAPSFLARTPRIGLRPPTWDELALLDRWAQDRRLDDLVGSELLAMCRHLGPHHPDFVAEALGSPTALTLLVQPFAFAAEPVGFVRLYNVNLAQSFLFLETAVADASARRRAACGIEATRLAAAFALDALGIERIEAKAYAYNAASINALKRNGFTLEGVLRQARTHAGRRWDILVFSMLDPEVRDEIAEDGFASMGMWSAPASPRC
jgi:RimJ/RimL family protein N-acetyltransferase